MTGPQRSPQDIRFVADNMLGKLAKSLRVLGYDVIYCARHSKHRITEMCARDRRILLTRSHHPWPRLEAALIFRLESDQFIRQLQTVVSHFSLDPYSHAFTRCTLCNAPLNKIEKQEAALQVAEMILKSQEEFFRCPRCNRIYWKGSHVENTLKRFSQLLSPRLS